MFQANDIAAATAKLRFHVSVQGVRTTLLA